MGCNPSQKCVECGAETATKKTMRCVSCIKERAKTRGPLWRKANPDKVRAYQRTYTAKKAPSPPGPGNPFYGNGTCKGCGQPVEGLHQSCEQCKAKTHRASAALWYANNLERKWAYQREWSKNNPEKGRLKSARWKASAKGQLYHASLRKLAVPRRPKLAVPARLPLMVYPFVRVPRDEHAQTLLVNSLVPRGMPGREDVVQTILLSLWEHETTIEQLKEEGIAPFLRQFRRENYEAGGYTMSLDQPMRDGRSWYDVLPGSAV